MLLFFLFYFYNNSIKLQENFYTYFNPFTTRTVSKFNLLYGNNFHNTHYFRNKYVFKYLTFGQAASDVYITKNPNKEYDMTFF